MKNRVLSVSAFFALAFLILVLTFISVSKVDYAFGQSATPAPILGQKVEVDYMLPFAGKIEPDHPLWTIKAIRDKVWVTTSLKTDNKIKVLVTLADKRIQHASHLMDKDKSELSVSTLTKSEKYLEEALKIEKAARAKKMDTKESAKLIVMSTLKHRQLLEELLARAPEDAKPVIVKTIDTNKRTFNEVIVSLNEQGIPSPENPFKD